MNVVVTIVVYSVLDSGKGRTDFEVAWLVADEDGFSETSEVETYFVDERLGE